MKPIFILLVEQQSLLDRTIAIAILFFILSLMSERVISWFKTSFFQKGNVFLWIFFDWAKDYSVDSKEVTGEEREGRIIQLNIVVSCLVALLAKANFFNILGENVPYTALGWHTSNFLVKGLLAQNNQINWSAFLNYIPSAFNTLTGCLLTGLFISLGSKFWHDTLDMLFMSKRLKEKASDPETYKQDSVDKINTYLSYSGQDIAEAAIKQNLAMFNNFKEFRYALPGLKKDGATGQQKPIIYAYVGTDGSGWPPDVEVTLSGSVRTRVSVEIVKNVSKAILHLDIRSGAPIGDNDGLVEVGTQACILVNEQNNSYYILTCGHALSHGKKATTAQIDNAKMYSWADIVGTCDTCEIDTNIDFGLVLLTESVPPSYKSNLSSDAYAIGETDKRKKVRVLGRDSSAQIKSGYLNLINQSYVFDYFGESVSFSNLMTVSDLIEPNGTSQPLSVPGDSGSAVILDNSLIGIIIGGDSHFSYGTDHLLAQNQVFKSN